MASPCDPKFEEPTNAHQAWAEEAIQQPENLTPPTEHETHQFGERDAECLRLGAIERRQHEEARQRESECREREQRQEDEARRR
eukprot:scaffold97_cov18-Tisochrysis_lutea.AAC.1